MAKEQSTRQEHLFTLRLWTEEVAADQRKWRGRLYDTTTGEVRYFREWAALIPLLLAMVREGEPPPTTPPDAPPGPTARD